MAARLLKQVIETLRISMPILPLDEHLNLLTAVYS
jgi:hypothetical protein